MNEEMEVSRTDQKRAGSNHRLQVLVFSTPLHKNNGIINN